MSLKILFQLPILLLIALTFINCSDDEQTLPVIEDSGWQRINNYSNEGRVQMNSLVVNDKLYTIGREEFTHLMPTGDTEKPYLATNHLLFTHYPYEFQPPISSLFFPVLQHSFIECVPSISPTLIQDILRFDLSLVDSLFWSFEYPSYKSSPGCGINDDNRLLVAYQRRVAPDTLLTNLSFYLADIEKSIGSGPLDTVGQYFIYENFGIRYLTGITAIGSDFYICGDNITVRINSDFTIEKLDAPWLTKVFGFDDKLIGVGFKNVHLSEDNGMSWTEIATFESNIFELKLHNLDGEIIATFEDKIFHFMDSEGNFLFDELNNEHLEDILITSFAKFDNKIFLTTLSGVFAKKIDDFWDYKES